MSDERELIAERERKVAELRAAGHNPYANGFRPTSTARSIHDWFASGADQGHPPQGTSDDGRVSVAGRIVAIRSFGKAAFAKIRDRTGEIQIWVKLDVVGEQDFAVWKFVERGDFVGV